MDEAVESLMMAGRTVGGGNCTLRLQQGTDPLSSPWYKVASQGCIPACSQVAMAAIDAWGVDFGAHLWKEKQLLKAFSCFIKGV